MNTDQALVLGIILSAFSFPAFLSALIDRRRPFVSGILSLTAAGLIVFASFMREGGYGIGDVPDTFVRVIGQLLH